MQRNLARFVPHFSYLEGTVRGNVHRPPCHEHSRHLASLRVSLTREAQKQSSGRATSRQVEGGGEQGERWLVHSTIWNGPFEIKENIQHLASLKCLAYGCVRDQKKV